jgi:hypothetical protein
MFLARYVFDGDPDDLLPHYERLMAGFPPGDSELHACVVTPGGVEVLDACPTEEAFEAFRSSEEFRAALRAAGLPAPRIEPVGHIHHLVTPAVAR